jgi:predicted metal-binding protein
VRVTSDVVIFVCTTCKREGDAPEAPRAGAALAEAASVAGGAYRVQPVKCLSNCKRGPSAALVRPGGWSYVFGHLGIEGTAEALQQGAALLGGSADGAMPWQGRPEVLKRNMIARIPPFDFTPVEAAP